MQLVRNGGGVSVGVVRSERKAEAARRLGCQVVVNRHDIGIGEEASGDPAQVIEFGKRLGRIIRREVREDPSIVFEYVGRATFRISLFVVRRGVVVTCGSSTGYLHQYDNRYLWMKLKRVVGSHAANLPEQYESNRLISMGSVMPTLSAVYPLSQVADAARECRPTAMWARSRCYAWHQNAALVSPIRLRGWP